MKNIPKNMRASAIQLLFQRLHYRPKVHYFSQWPIIVFNFGMVTPEAKCDHETHHGKWDVFKGVEGMDMSQN